MSLPESQAGAQAPGYTTDFHTVRTREFDYIVRRRGTAALELLAIKLPALKQATKSLKGKTRSEFEEQVGRIETWQAARQRLTELILTHLAMSDQLELATDLSQREKLSSQRDNLKTECDTREQELEAMQQELVAWLQTKLHADDAIGAILKQHVPAASLVANRRPIGLAFSGGGIRSASFNLGLAQSLSRYRILPWVDYLSTVSGGGLIGGCITSLLSQFREFNTQWESFPFNPHKKVFCDDIHAGDAHQHPALDRDGHLEDGHNTQLEHLRNKGNYLIPRSGILNRDTLRSVGTILLGINYTVIIFVLVLIALSITHYAIAAALAPSILGDIEFREAASPSANSSEPQTDAPEPDEGDQGAVIFYTGDDEIRLDASEAAPSGAQASGTTYLDLLFRDYRAERPGERKPIPWSSFALALVTGYVCSIATFLLLLDVHVYRNRLGRRIFVRYKRAWTNVANEGLEEQEYIDRRSIRLVVGVFVLFLLISMVLLKAQNDSSAPGPQVFLIWLPALFTLGAWLGLIVLRLIGFEEPGRQLPRFVDAIYWILRRLLWRIPRGGDHPKSVSVWSNTGFRSIFWAWHGLGFFTFIALVTLTLLAVPHFFTSSGGLGQSVPYATIVSAGLSVLLTYSGGKQEGSGNPLSKLLARFPSLTNPLLGLLVIILILSIVYMVQRGIDTWVAGSSLDTAGVILRLGVAAALFGLAAMVFGRLVNFNYVSPHYFARDRISDAYLRTEVVHKGDSAGAVTLARDHGGLRMRDIVRDGDSTPYHLIVTALNLPGSWHMNFRSRKSQHFIFARDYCGSQITGYVETAVYRAGLTKYSRAIAISGAAVSSSLGYLTFFAQAFVTTLLNARLGLWLTNPLEHVRAWKACALDQASTEEQRQLMFQQYQTHLTGLEKGIQWLKYLWVEMRGGPHERGRMINLSDGGHTGDNGALYPLFQRRCEVIIAGDASRDPKFTFRDLFRVIHQVQTDLDIHVDMNIEGHEPEVEDEQVGLSQRHFSMGKITYPADAQRGLPQETGWLLYFKPTMTADAPAALKHYQKMHEGAFPHVSTLDQFFDEEQFEAYRLLGEFTVESMLMGCFQSGHDGLVDKTTQQLIEVGLPEIMNGLQQRFTTETSKPAPRQQDQEKKGLMQRLTELIDGLHE